MIRKLLATTAFATLIASGAFAQETQPAAPADPAVTAPAGTASAPARVDGEHLASNIIGEAVYNGNGQDAERIGDVNDLVVDKDGKIKSVVVGVGGFLGIGEKNVALDFTELKWNDPVASGTAADGSTTASTGDRWLVTAATKDSLQALPDFDRSVYDEQPAATTAMSQNADGSMSTGTMASPTVADNATTAAPAAGGTMAPADNGAMTNNMAATPDATQTAAIDRSTLTDVPADQLTAENLVGTTVYGANDTNVGDISDIVLSQDGKVDAVLIDVGGFLGIGSKTVAVGMDKLSFLQDADNNRYLYTTFTKEQLDAQAAYNADTYASDRQNQRLTVQ
jgi:sporulation protein YlmC with PRC-barrel domain